MPRWLNFSLFFIIFTVIFFGANQRAEAKALLPDGAGFYSGWTGAYTDIDEYPTNDGDTSTSTVSAVATQSYSLENNSDSGAVNGVRVILYAKVAGTQEKLFPLLRLNGVDDSPIGAECAGLDGAGYKYCSYYWTTKPGGGSWSASDLSNLEAGFKTSLSGAAWEDAVYKVTQMYVDVVFKTTTKKLKFHLFQKVGVVNGAVDEPFSFSIGDPVDSIQSAFVELKGLAAISSVNLGVKVDNNSATPGAYDAIYPINSSGRPTLFKIDHNVTDYFKTFVKNSGTYERYIHLTADNNIYLLNAKLVITYTKIIPPPAVAGNYPATGEFTSNIFDTGSTGAAYNSILWKGSLGTGGAGRVRFQLATSNCSNGRIDPPTCSTGTWNYVGGASCFSGDWFEPESPYADTPVEIKCYTELNNKRYYRYKAQICSHNCSTGGDYTPTVDDVVVSWSP